MPLQQLSGPKEASSCAMFHSICQEVGDDEGIDKFEAGWGLITGEYCTHSELIQVMIAQLVDITVSSCQHSSGEKFKKYPAF